VTLAALGFVAALVYGQWSALRSYRWQLEPAWAVVALIGLELTWLYELDIWRSILNRLGGSLSYPRAAQAWFLSNVIRYIPGNVWQFIGMAELAAEDGVPRAATFTSIVLHQAICSAGGLVLASLYFAFAGVNDWFPRLRPFLMLVPLGLLLLQPRILEWILNRTLIRLGREPLHITLTWGQVWVLQARYLVVWFGEGLSYAALARAISPVDWSAVPYLAACWVASYIIGYLSLLTPSGLGVREGIMLLLLAAVMPSPVAAVFVIFARLWMVMAEVLAALMALAWRRVAPARQPKGTP
jgi:hypothetical protein